MKRKMDDSFIKKYIALKMIEYSLFLKKHSLLVLKYLVNFLFLEESWTKFFEKAGIPELNATTYASIFLDNVVTEDLLCKLDHRDLMDMNITAWEHRQKIIDHILSNNVGISLHSTPSFLLHYFLKISLLLYCRPRNEIEKRQNLEYRRK